MGEMYVERTDVWVAAVPDRPGGLATVLAGLNEVGADLEFVLARRASDDPGGVVFVTPLSGDTEVAAAGTLGFHAAGRVHSVRIEADNERGAGAALAAKLAEAGINVRGFTAAAIGRRFVACIGLDSAEDADRVVALLRPEG